MFSPNSGSLNSVTSAASEGTAGAAVTDAGAERTGSAAFAGADSGGAAWAAVVFSVFGSAAGGADAARFPPAPFSTVKITWPTLIFSPSFTRTSFTTPLTDEGTSTTALSVSSSITGSPSETDFQASPTAAPGC